jgi:hypothetical protein
MSYDQQKFDVALLPPTSLADAAFIAGSRSYPGTPLYIRRLWAVVTATVVTAACVVTFTYRPTPGSAAGQVTLGTLTIPNGTTPGKIVTKNLASSPQKIIPGGEIVVSFSGGSGAGGLAAVGVSGDPSWESDSNNANNIVSA